MQSRYDKEGSERQTDEFLTPIIVDKEGCIQDGDTLMFIDFRADRMRQIVKAIAIERNFETSVVPQNIVSKKKMWPCLYFNMLCNPLIILCNN